MTLERSSVEEEDFNGRAPEVLLLLLGLLGWTLEER
jgi:hypothetical protein